MAEDDEVGYGKPPRYTRFKKGQSGNPSGRPKGRIGLKATLQKLLSEKVTVNINGRSRKISKWEAAIRQQIIKAAKGDATACRIMMALAQSIDDPTDGRSDRGRWPTVKFIIEG